MDKFDISSRAIINKFNRQLAELRGAYGRKGKVGGSSKTPTSQKKVYDFRDKEEIRFTSSAKFKKWFSGSKAINYGGNLTADTPKKYYHNSGRLFSKFLTPEELEKKGFDRPTYRDTLSGIYFSENPNRDDFYGKNEYQVFLSIKNPYRSRGDTSGVSLNEIRKLKSNGFDGIFGVDEVIVFDPKQVLIYKVNGKIKE